MTNCEPNTAKGPHSATNDGGCVSISADGRTWNCYLGQSAVEQDIIGPTLLGHYQPDRPTG